MNPVTRIVRSTVASLNLRGMEDGDIRYAVDAQPNTAPAQGGGTGSLVARINGQWSALPVAGSAGMLNPMTAPGDLIRGGTSGTPTRLPGNVTATKMYLTQTGNGSVANPPVWEALIAGDLGNGTTGTGKTVLQDAPTINNAILVTPTFDTAQGTNLNLASAGKITWNNDIGWQRYQNPTYTQIRAMQCLDPSLPRSLGEIWGCMLEVGTDDNYYPGSVGPGQYLHAVRAVTLASGDPDRWDKWEGLTGYVNIRNLTRSSTTTND